MTWQNFSPLAAPLPVVVSYYTGPVYEREAYQLARSCREVPIDYYVEGRADAGGWLANTNAKPAFLAECDRRFPDRAILWLDADARVHRLPSLLRGLEAPIAYHTWHGRPASGTVYLAPGPQRAVILACWIDEVERAPLATDQVCMGRAVARLELEHFELPTSYCSIYDFDYDGKRRVADPASPCVIEHMQASRLTKRGAP